MQEHSVRPELDLPAADQTYGRKNHHKHPTIVQHVAQDDTEAGTAQQTGCSGKTTENLHMGGIQSMAEQLLGRVLNPNRLNETLIRRRGSVDHLPMGEEAPEALLLKGSTLISHIHLLMDIYPASVIHPDAYITKLGPGEHHQIQISAGHGQYGTHLTGTKALRRDSWEGAQGEIVAQEQKPEENRQTGADTNQTCDLFQRGKIRTGLREHLLVGVQVHSEGFVIL